MILYYNFLSDTILTISCLVSQFKDCQDSLHFQIPSSHVGGPVNINIGLSLDYSTIPPQHRLDSLSSTNATPIRPWSNRSLKQSTSLSELLKDAPSYTSKSGNVQQELPPVGESQEESSELQPTTPPTEITSPDVAIMSHGGDTPNSMAVERATEPSLRSYSPTSSIRAPSDVDFTESSPPPLNFASHDITTPEPGHQEFHYPTESPMTESVATLVPTDSPKSVTTAAAARGNESGDDYVVVSSAASKTAATGGGATGLSSSVVDVSAKSGIDVSAKSGASTSNTGTSPPAVVATGKAFLGKGRIDAKAQDDFIAFMLGKK